MAPHPATKFGWEETFGFQGPVIKYLKLTYVLQGV